MSDDTAHCQVAILAGGMGTRLKSRTGDLPKPMAPILGRPVLEHQIDLCRRHGFTRIALLLHYGVDAIRAHFGDGERFGVQLTYSLETTARGTAGALRDALALMDDRFIVLYGDTYADVDLRALWKDHLASGSAATLLLHPNDHPHDSDLVEVDANGQIVAVHPYPHPADAVHANLVNAALYVMEHAGLTAHIPETGRSDLAKQTFPALLAAGLRLHAYVTPEYIKDMGTPERLDKVERDIVAGLPERLSDRRPRAAVFLDRDGTINVEVSHLNDPAQLQLIDGAGEAVRTLNRAGLLAVGVTNQPVIARGEASWATVGRIHATLDRLLGAHGAWLDRMYVCPHHPDRGYAGEVVALKIRCECRKPDTGLIDRAVRELKISRRASWMVGDMTSDIRAGLSAGLRTVLVRTGHAGLDGKLPDEADYTMPDLAAAVDWILHGHPRMWGRLLAVASRAADARLVLIGGAVRSGKGCAARVLAEQLELGGRTVHRISLDGWLRPPHERPEGGGVLARYDLTALRETLSPMLQGTGRYPLEGLTYNRKTRLIEAGVQQSVGPTDILIVEGVPALMDPFLVANSTLRLYLDVDDLERSRRLVADYAWRDGPGGDFRERLASREVDELPSVRASAAHATDRIEST